MLDQFLFGRNGSTAFCPSPRCFSSLTAQWQRGPCSMRTFLTMIPSQSSKANISQPAAQNAALQKAFESRHDLLRSIPSVPAILQSLIGELAQDPAKVDMKRVADFIGRDKSL